MQTSVNVHAAWLPPEAFHPIGSRHTLVHGTGTFVETAYQEIGQACGRYGGSVRATTGTGPVDLLLWLSASDRVSTSDRALTSEPLPPAVEAVEAELARRYGPEGDLFGDEGYAVARLDGVTVVLARAPTGLLYGLFHVVRHGEAMFAATRPAELHRPALALRMLDHWDNVDVHPVMGQVERGYSGGSIFWRDGAPREDLDRVKAYARLLAATGINAVAVNNVNVHATEAHLLTDRLGEVRPLRTSCGGMASGCTCRSASPRRWSSAGCPPPTR